ncbi:coatomer subunit delta-like [Planoprotostelium fungivorum]|uniref:Coatomer subunit delta n=1 Tax=Planoprotostelium fungivorum TaxID=1890364 RepID=A0A2P6MWZ9_9EUKA|nr:coatomer subunit delta-like [Planoprotostelium fungivorum]
MLILNQVVLAAAVTTKSGKALLSRQFVELTKARIEGLLAAFPKLIGSEKQHTFIETDSIRYVYQPLESLYVLLLTNKSSNILEDLDSLHLLAKIVPEYCSVLEEKEITRKAFEIIFAFDEAVAMGYKERVNIQQIKHFTAMESNDELRYKSEQKTKMLQAKKAADKARKEMDKKRASDRKHGISSDTMSHVTNTSSNMRSTFQNEPVVETKREAPKVESKPSGRGLQLGKTKKAAGLDKILQEEGGSSAAAESVSSSSKQESLSSGPAEKVSVQVLEKIVLEAENDGALENMVVTGELIVTVFDSQYSKVKVKVRPSDAKEFQYKSHPNMDKGLFTNKNVLALKDDSKFYPNATPSPVLKWRYATKDEDAVPLTISIWPSVSGKNVTVPVEFEKKVGFDLYDVTITIPLPSSPIIGESSGTCDYDQKKGLLHWHIPLIDDSNSTGTLEFSVVGNASTSFLPVEVNFRSNSVFSNLTVEGVVNEDNQPVPFSQETGLSVDSYNIK